MTLIAKQKPGLAGIGSLALMIALAGCATGTAQGDATANNRSGALPSDCIMGGSVRDYRALDNQNLILYGAGRRPYHVVLVTPAFGLESEFSIGVYDRDGALSALSRICPYGGDAIIIDGPITERIPIRSIEAIDDEAVDALLVQFGKIEPAEEDEITVTEIETTAVND